MCTSEVRAPHEHPVVTHTSYESDTHTHTHSTMREFVEIDGFACVRVSLVRMFAPNLDGIR